MGSDRPGPGFAVGDRVKADIGAIAHGGHFVARVDGFVVFVRYALPGERVVVKITELRKGFARGDAVEVLDPHPDRVASPCPAFGPGGCGGCDFQHATPSLQRDLKLTVLREALSTVAALPAERIDELLSEGLRDLGMDVHWRTRMRFTTLATSTGGSVVGLHRHRSADLIDASSCVISDPRVLRVCSDLATELPGGQELTAAVGVDGDVVVSNRQPSGGGGHRGGKRRRRSRSISPDRATVHESVLTSAGPVAFEPPVDGFWQVHPRAVEVISEALVEFGQPSQDESWWDLYSGMGPFAVTLVDKVGPGGSVTSVEASPAAVAAGRRSIDSFPNIHAVCSDVRKWLLGPATGPVDGVVLDPPRSGAGREVVEAITAFRPRTVVYVACDPMALARDVAYFADYGYHLWRIRAWDAFPHTHHMEAAAAFVPADQIS